jgi:hypothetical protein
MVVFYEYKLFGLMKYINESGGNSDGIAENSLDNKLQFLDNMLTTIYGGLKNILKLS